MTIVRRFLLGAAALALGAGIAALPAVAQDFPTRSVRVIVPFAAGGPTDVVARVLADQLSQTMGQRFVVENRTGAGVVVGADAVAKSAADGHTLLYTTVAHVVTPVMFRTLPFDPVRDFAPVALVGQVPLVLVVNPQRTQARSLREFLDWMKANPGRADFGTAGNGSATHMGAALFVAMAGVNANHVPYRGTAQASNDLIAGQITFITEVAATAFGSMRAGTLRGLAISSKTRHPQMPDLPAFDEAGVPGYEAYTWHMIYAPAGTQAPVIARLNREVNAALQLPAIRTRLDQAGVTIVSDSTPQSAAAFAAAEAAKWAPILRAAGVTPE